MKRIFILFFILSFATSLTFGARKKKRRTTPRMVAVNGGATLPELNRMMARLAPTEITVDTAFSEKVCNARKPSPDRSHEYLRDARPTNWHCKVETSKWLKDNRHSIGKQ